MFSIRLHKLLFVLRRDQIREILKVKFDSVLGFYKKKKSAYTQHQTILESNFHQILHISFYITTKDALHLLVYKKSFCNKIILCAHRIQSPTYNVAIIFPLQIINVKQNYEKNYSRIKLFIITIITKGVLRIKKYHKMTETINY